MADLQIAQSENFSGSRNRHPVDELADIRDAIKRLKDREDEIRKLIIEGSCSSLGDQYSATIQTTSSERVDTKALREKLTSAELSKFLKVTMSTVVKVSKREIHPDEYD